MTRLKVEINRFIYVFKYSIVTWVQLLLLPTTENYHRISNGPITQDPKRTFLWTYGWLIFLCFLLAYPLVRNSYNNNPDHIANAIFFAISSYGSFIVAITLYASANHFFASRLLEGKGTLKQTLFIYSGLILAVFIFLMILTTILSPLGGFSGISKFLYSKLQPIQFRSIVFIAISYGIFLHIQAIRTIHQISVPQSITTIVLSIIPLIILLIILSIVPLITLLF